MAQTINTERPAQEMTWDQRLLRNSGRQKAALKPEYQELKFTLHRKLLDKINLEALATIDNQRVRAEVRQAVISLIDGEPTLLSSLEKQQISEEVLDEVFGLGPLEPLLQDPTISDILVNTHKQVYIERKGLLVMGMRAHDLVQRLGAEMGGSHRAYERGVSRSLMGRIADALPDQFLRDLASSDVLWDEIVAIEPLGEQPVFDATVPGAHNFVGNGLVAHNSIEQDADVVIFIYRDEYYNPESEQRGMAEIIVAKHRNGPTGASRLAFLEQYTKFANLART